MFSSVRRLKRALPAKNAEFHRGTAGEPGKWRLQSSWRRNIGIPGRFVVRQVRHSPPSLREAPSLGDRGGKREKSLDTSVAGQAHRQLRRYERSRQRSIIFNRQDAKDAKVELDRITGLTG